MPKKRQPRETWQQTRARVLERDRYVRQHCGVEVTEKTAHKDHTHSGKLAGNEIGKAVRALTHFLLEP
jgi:hypothetical protein